MSKNQVILWYDTKCNLCQKYVTFIKKRDRKGITEFKSIYDHPNYVPDTAPGTMIVVIDGVEYIRSRSAVLHWRRLGGLIGIVGYSGAILPNFLRDLIYKYIAKNRYRWFGKCDCE